MMEIGYKQLQAIAYGQRRRRGIKNSFKRWGFWLYAAAVLGAMGIILAAMIFMVIF